MSKNTNKRKNMKLKLMGVSSTDTNIEVKFQLAGDNLESEEIFRFLQKQTADNEIKLKVENDTYTFTKSLTSSTETTEFISRIKDILDELIMEDERKKKETPRNQVERSLVLWLANKVLKGEVKLKLK